MMETKEQKKTLETAPVKDALQGSQPLRPEDIFKQAEIDYEHQDVDGVRLIGSFIIGTIVVAIVMFAISQYFVISREEQMLEIALKPENNLLRDVRQREEGILNSYKVIDEKKGIYQIPISEAMKIIADEAYQKKKAVLEAQMKESAASKDDAVHKPELRSTEVKKSSQK